MHWARLCMSVLCVFVRATAATSAQQLFRRHYLGSASAVLWAGSKSTCFDTCRVGVKRMT
jgi:hypothetical protein